MLAIANPFVLAAVAFVLSIVVLAMDRSFRRNLVAALSNQKGQFDGTAIMNTIFIFILVVFLIPVAMDQFAGVDDSAWPTAVQNFWPLLPLLVIFGIGFALWKRARD